MTAKTCDACWCDPRPGLVLGTWTGFADWATTFSNPRPSYRTWKVCTDCARELGLTLKVGA